MKRTSNILLTILAVFLATSCKVNNGDIGPLFGTWAVTEMKVDGEVYDGWKDSEHTFTAFSFQNDICHIQTADSHDSPDSRTCTWKWMTEDTRIELDFTHHDDKFDAGTYYYKAPEWLLLETNTVHIFDVVWDGEKKMTWTTVNAAGQRLEYRLKKTW